MKYYQTPGGRYPEIYENIIEFEPHVLIAGATGSGKSVLINSLIAYILMTKSPQKANLILIDPKKVELQALRKLPHTIYYADEPSTAATALFYAVDLMDTRYKEMQRKGLKKYEGAAIYIIIDEYADLMVTARKQIEPLVTRLVQLGRAANVHLIIATQRPTREVIAGAVRVNLDCKIALHTATAQDSRNIINQTGAESLPRYGFGYMLNSDGLKMIKIDPFDSYIPDLVKYWSNPIKCMFSDCGEPLAIPNNPLRPQEPRTETRQAQRRPTWSERRQERQKKREEEKKARIEKEKRRNKGFAEYLKHHPNDNIIDYELYFDCDIWEEEY